jgi:hypothetical protein
MSDEKKERWLNYLAFSSVILAVCATLSTFKGGSYSTRTVLSQTQASDQWAFYQSKSIKGYLYEIQKTELEIELQNLKGDTPENIRKQMQAHIAAYDSNITRYDSEKAEIQKKAREFESVRDHALLHGGSFHLAVIFLQIAILLSSISALMKKKPVWILGLATGVFGVIYFINGFFVFIK